MRLDLLNMKLKALLVSILVSLVICGCKPSQVNKPSDSQEEVYITAKVEFRAYTNNQQKLENVSIVIIGSEGQVLDVLVTNRKGVAKRTLTVPIDKKYKMLEDYHLQLRGTVTAIAFKDGYRETVLFEVPVKNASIQPFYMAPFIPGERNEPIAVLGNNHHLEILSLVQEYSQYIH